MDEATPATPPADWNQVEIFGHRVRCGIVTEVERFGTKLCQVACYRPGEAEPFAVEQYGGASIFSMSPCTEEYARDYHRRYDPPPRLALPAAGSFEAEFEEEPV